MVEEGTSFPQEDYLTTESVKVLGHNGGEYLTGRGDAIIKYGDGAAERRFQTALTPEKDSDYLIGWWRDQWDEMHKSRFRKWLESRRN